MNAKPIIHAGIALIFFGIAALTYQGVMHSDEKVVDIARLTAAADSQKNFPLSPLIGGLVLVGGVVLVVVGLKTSS